MHIQSKLPSWLARSDMRQFAITVLVILVVVVDEVSSIGQQTAAEAQSVSAAAEEQTASLTEVSDSAESLADRAVDLSSVLDAFDLGTESDTPDRDGVREVGSGTRAVTDGGRR